MQRIGAQIRRLALGMGFESPLRLARIRARWRETIQPPLANHAWPHSLERGTLTLVADSSSWAQQLGFLRDELVEKFSDFGVKEIRLMTGRVPEPDRYGPREEPGHASREDLELAETEASRIEDQGLRESLRKAIRSWAGRKTRGK